MVSVLHGKRILNIAPFDLSEAESELVSGFMTEHAGVVLVFFFSKVFVHTINVCIN